jgi:hypothetical protein
VSGHLGQFFSPKDLCYLIHSESYVLILNKKMGWATFWAIFHTLVFVTLIPDFLASESTDQGPML